MLIVIKQYISRNLTDSIILLFFFSLLLLTGLMNIQAGFEIQINFIKFFIEMISFIPLIFILVGLFDVWFPKQKVEKHIGKDSGITGIIWVIFLAMLQAGPLYGAFPVAYLLWKKGAGTRNIFIYLGAFSTLKLPMLGFEIGFLGLKFTLLRSLITLPVFIIIAFIIEYYLRNRNFEMHDITKINKL